DREQTRDLAAGRVDVHDDVFFRILGLEDEQLRDQEVRDAVVDGRAEEDDAIVRETRIRIPFHAAPRGVLDESRHRDVLVTDTHASDSFISMWGISFSW